MNSFPYCRHPDCHDSRTAYYADIQPAEPGTERPQGRHIIVGFRHEHPNLRRWCRIHAFMFEGVAAR